MISAEGAIAQAIITRAARNVLLAQSSMGRWGEMEGSVALRPDYATQEILYGISLDEDAAEIDLETLVSVEDVIRAGLQADPDNYPEDELDDVERALQAAIWWVNLQIEGQRGFA